MPVLTRRSAFLTRPSSSFAPGEPLQIIRQDTAIKANATNRLNRAAAIRRLTSTPNWTPAIANGAAIKECAALLVVTSPSAAINTALYVAMTSKH